MKKLVTTSLLSLSLLSSAMPVSAAETKTAYFAAGCFWCIEKDFEKIDGVLEATSGYTGGSEEDAVYKKVGTQKTGHYEGVAVQYDPNIVSYPQLLSVFWKNHDPFDARGQFCDKGASYRAAIFPQNDAERAAAESSLAAAQKKFSQKIVTPIIDAMPFYNAEEYHQDYYKKSAVKYRFYRWNCGRDQRLEDIAEMAK